MWMDDRAVKRPNSPDQKIPVKFVNHDIAVNGYASLALDALLKDALH